jgi:hypothetical protein
MNPTTLKPVIVPAFDDESPPPSFRRIVRNTALLNLVIVLTSFPFLILAAGPNAVVPTLAVMAGISVLIWTATFALFSLVSLPRLFRRPASTVTRHDLPHRIDEAGVADRWLDGPM